MIPMGNEEKKYGRGPGAQAGRAATIGTAAALGAPYAIKGGYYLGKGLLGGLQWSAQAAVNQYKNAATWIGNKVNPPVQPTIIPESHRLNAPGGQTGSPKLLEGPSGPAQRGNVPSGNKIPAHGFDSADEVAKYGKQTVALADDVAAQETIAKARGLSHADWLKNTRAGQAVSQILKSRALQSTNTFSLLAMLMGPSLQAYEQMMTQDGNMVTYH